MTLTHFYKIGMAIVLIQVLLLLFYTSKFLLLFRERSVESSSDLQGHTKDDYWGDRPVLEQDSDLDSVLHRGPNRQGGLQSEEERHKRAFYAVMLQSRQKDVLSPGCPDRGLGGRVTSLAFLKVHKSASTTVANMLARYALRHTLNVALPSKTPGTMRYNYFEPQITTRDVLPIPRNQSYQVIFNHMIFNRRDLESFLPDSTFYFAIMRDPLSRFISSFVYYGYAKFFVSRYRLSSVKDAIMLFIRRPQLMKESTIPEVYNSLAGNTGLHPALHRDAHFVEAHIKTTERDLDLIMLVEYFDESLVLLKRMACLSMQDIVYMAKNARSQDHHVRVNLDPEERAAFDEFQKADTLMYQHFYQKFWERVYAQGSDFFLEVRQFKEIERTVVDFCRRVSSVWDVVVVQRSLWNEEFVVTARECRLMNVTELHMQMYLIDRALKLYHIHQTGGLPKH